MARQVLLLQVGVVLVLVVASSRWRRTTRAGTPATQATDRALAVAEAVADSPAVVEAVQASDPSPALQPYAEQVRADTDVDFVVVMGLDRTRYTHPDPDQIGKPFVGDLGGAPDGESFTQQYTGTLGPSMRAVVPVLDGDRVVAMVSVGITISAIDRQLRDDLVLILRLGAGRARRRPARRLAGRTPAPAADARPGRGRDHPDVRVLHGGPARRPRGTAADRRRRAGAARERRGAPAARPSGRRRRPAAGRPRPGAGSGGRPRVGSRPPTTTSTSRATARWWSARRPRPGTAGRSVPW